MNAILLLKQQHRQLGELFRRYGRESRSPPEVRHALASDIADEVLAHANVEERHFYRAITSAQTEDDLRKCLDEHLAVRRLTSEVLLLDARDPRLDARVAELGALVAAHMEYEERELFARVERVLDRQTLDALGSIIELALEQIRRQPPPRSVAMGSAYPGGLQ